MPKFQKGKSGNPLGRPRNRIASLIEQNEKISSELLPVVENGVRKKMTERQLSARTIANRMAKGDIAAWKWFIRQSKQEKKTAPKHQGFKFVIHPDGATIEHT